MNPEKHIIIRFLNFPKCITNIVTIPSLQMKENKKKVTRILGIDPGSTIIGFGVIDGDKSARPKVIDYGYIDLKQYQTQQEKLFNLNKDLKSIINKFNPDTISVENIYFFKNSKTFIAVSEAKGVILLSAAIAGIKAYEYTPLQVKQTVAGYGKADKNLVQKLIQTSLDIRSKISPDDSSDALAIALCHFYHLGRS